MHIRSDGTVSLCCIDVESVFGLSVGVYETGFGRAVDLAGADTGLAFAGAALLTIAWGLACTAWVVGATYGGVDYLAGAALVISAGF